MLDPLRMVLKFGLLCLGTVSIGLTLNGDARAIEVFDRDAIRLAVEEDGLDAGQAPGLGGAPRGAPHGAPRGGGPGPGPARTCIFLAMRLADALNLTDDETIQVKNSCRSIDDKRRGLLAERSEVEAGIERELAKRPIDDAALTKLAGQAQEIDRKIALLPEDAFAEVAKILTSEQRARLVLFKRQMKEQLQGERARRGVGGGPGAGPGVGSAGPGSGEGGGGRRGGFRRWWQGSSGPGGR